jgi:carboxymethylenebutenolidase
MGAPGEQEETRMIIHDNEFVDIPTPTGPMRLHVFRPVAPGRYPGLVYYSEIFQVTGPIRRAAAMLAGHGHLVVVPEVYHEFEPPGTVLNYDQAGSDRGNALKTTKEISAWDSDARAAIDYLKASPHCTGRVGIMGICLGGHLAFRAAMNPEVLATVCCYATDIHKGSLGKSGDDTISRVKDIKGELLMVWGRQDPHVPREGRAKIYNALADADLHFQWHEFNAAHAFMRDEGYRYDPAWSHLCWSLIIELFHRKLGEGDLRTG